MTEYLHWVIDDAAWVPGALAQPVALALSLFTWSQWKSLTTGFSLGLEPPVRLIKQLATEDSSSSVSWKE